MSTLAQDEVSRLLSQEHTRSTAHPEDLDNSDRDSVDEAGATEPAFEVDPNQDTDDEEFTGRMASLSTTKPTYILPTAVQYANTGPKGVIADAQSFTRAKKDAYKIPVTKIITKVPVPVTTMQEKDGGSSSEEEEDADFMAQWRAARLAELAAETDKNRTLSPHGGQQRRVSPSRRTYGTAVRVDAAGYLDAIEKVSSETMVVVLIYDRDSSQSSEVEEEVDILAYKYGHVRFVKLDHRIAEMEHVEIPALLVYKGGDVCTTVSGAKREGLAKLLEQQGVFN